MLDQQTPVAVKDLAKTYRQGLLRRRSVAALRGVSFEIPRGQIFGLLGPNGAGKTTLLKILLGIVKKSGGQAALLGRPAGDRNARRHVGYLPESHRIPRHLTGDTALEYYGSLSGLSPRETRSRRPALLELVGLQGWGATPVSNYSKGMLQRLGLAQAILHDPPLLVLDEPTDGVDPVGRSDIRDILKQLKDRGKTVLINSHLLQEIQLVCDRVVILDRGQVVAQGSMEELTRPANDDVIFELAATAAAAESALACWPIVSDESPVAPAGSPGGARCRVTLTPGGQTGLDAAIDALRRAGVSIVSVARPKQTLEEVFLNIVRQETAA